VLVLSRKLGEKLLISGGIAITILEIQGNRVRLGVAAPAHIDILREELVPHGEPLAPGEVGAGETGGLVEPPAWQETGR
jgi:carbon storage regulator